MPRSCRAVFNVAVALAAGCLGGSPTSFSPEHDDRAMETIASSWSSSGSATELSLCEDLTVELGDNGCHYGHQVRGGGRGLRHEHEGGIGCGGCPLDTGAAVKGTFSSASLGTVEVAGTIHLQSAYHDDPYEFPYHVDLHCVTGQCTLSGILNEDGSLELDVDGVLPVTLARTAAAACP